MKISLTRQLVNKQTGSLQNVDVIGTGITAEHAFENASAKLDAIENRHNAVQLYKSNLQLIKRHESGESLTEQELEATKNQIAEFEAAELEFIAKRGEELLEVGGIDIASLIPIVVGIVTNFFSEEKKKPAKKSAAKKAAPKKSAAKKTAGKK